MGFHGSLGDVEVASDLRVVTPLKQQIDDLPFPGTYLAELFFHMGTAPDRCVRVAAKWR
jgi:hypothetical protein